MEIVPATTDDVDAIASLWIDLAADQRIHGSHLHTEENRVVVSEQIARFAVVDELVLARTNDDRVVGFAMGTIETTSYEKDVVRGIVENLYVEPSSRNAGIGSDLLATLENRLAAAGAEVIALEALASNDAACRFYGRHGYDPHRIEFEKRVGPD